MPSTHDTLDHDHHHIVLTARGLAAPPRTAEAVIGWLGHLVSAAGMKGLMRPIAARGDTKGNTVAVNITQPAPAAQAV
jgi:hypothetical protein